MHLKPTAECQISILIFEKKIVEVGSLLISHEKYIKDGKVLAHFTLLWASGVLSHLGTSVS
jgi:hypothetical protein